MMAGGLKYSVHYCERDIYMLKMYVASERVIFILKGYSRY